MALLNINVEVLKACENEGIKLHSDMGLDRQF